MNRSKAVAWNKSGQKIRKRDLLAAPGKKLTDIAKQALHEAAERRRLFDPCGFAAPDSEEERLEPTRYSDWEANGKCSDF